MSENRKCWYCGSEPMVWHDDVNLFAECPNEDCPNYGDNGFEALVLSVWNTRPIEDALQNRIDELEAQLRWIPVSERLPEITDDYLTVQCGDFYDIQILTFRGGVFGLFDDLDGWIGTEDLVTHWRPLPEPPEVQQ